VARGNILQAHKRVGKRLIPPMKQLEKVKFTNYVNDILPELVWTGLIYDRIGYAQGARVVEHVVRAACQAVGQKPRGNYAPISQLATLCSSERSQFLKKLSDATDLEKFRQYLAPLILLYRNCPISFIGPPERVYQEAQLDRRMRACVAGCIDKYSTPGIAVIGSMLLSRLASGTMHFPKDMELPNFNSIFDNPASDDAKRAAGFIRASALADFGAMQLSNEWASSFWNQNFAISDCEFGNDE
jgi:hypothetical protein